MGNLKYLSESEIRILESLSLFKYMTSSRFIKLGIVKHKSTLSSVIKRLKEYSPNILGEIPFGYITGIGKFEKVFYLTRHGIKFVEENLYISSFNIKSGYGKVFSSRDYFHRMAVVDFQIELYKWLAKNMLELKSFRTYYDRATAYENTKLDVWDKGTLISDAESHFKSANKDYVFNLEIIRGKEPGRVMKNLHLYMEALYHGVPSIKYNISRGTYIVLIFEDDVTMKTVLDRLRDSEIYSSFHDNIYIKKLGSISDNFSEGWIKPGGSGTDFLGIKCLS